VACVICVKGRLPESSLARSGEFLKEARTLPTLNWRARAAGGRARGKVRSQRRVEEKKRLFQD
jgi:hypothetical protein